MENVRILCFGDSLTAGYSYFGETFTPYAENMNSWLNAAWPATKVTVDVDGLSGDRVISESFLSRIIAKCKLTSFLASQYNCYFVSTAVNSRPSITVCL